MTASKETMLTRVEGSREERAESMPARRPIRSAASSVASTANTTCGGCSFASDFAGPRSAAAAVVAAAEKDPLSEVNREPGEVESDREEGLVTSAGQTYSTASSHSSG